jgi:hypothetical protein
MEDGSEPVQVSGELAQAQDPDGVWVTMESIRAGSPGSGNVIQRSDGSGRGESRR